MKEILDWYDSFQLEIARMESTEKCPICGSGNIYNTNPFGYDFACGDCCSSFEIHGKYEKELEMLAIDH